MKIYSDIQYKTVSGIDKNLHSLDIYTPEDGENHPVIVMVHGGFWSKGDKKKKSVYYYKSRYYTEKGYIFISINYRLSPAVEHPVHVQDVASALSYTYDNIADYGGNPDEIYIMGHSAGAHLASLIATNDKYLKDTGKDLSIIKGVISIDTAAYKIDEELVNRNLLYTRLYTNAFSTNKRLWNDASPIENIENNKNIPPFLILYSDHPTSIRIEGSLEMAKKLREAGIPALAWSAKDKTHGQMNSEIGQKGDRKTVIIDEFLENPVKFNTEFEPELSDYLSHNTLPGGWEFNDFDNGFLLNFISRQDFTEEIFLESDTELVKWPEADSALKNNLKVGYQIVDEFAIKAGLDRISSSGNLSLGLSLGIESKF